MMKQSTIMALALSATLVSGVAVAGPDGVFNNKATIGTADSGLEQTCVMLNENTNLSLSKGVTAGYQCVEAANFILVASCHEGGNRTGAVTCTNFDHDNDPTTAPLIIGEGCTQTMVDKGEKATAPSYMAFGGSSAGGAMNEIPLPGRCYTDGSNLQAVTGYWQ